MRRSVRAVATWFSFALGIGCARPPAPLDLALASSALGIEVAAGPPRALTFDGAWRGPARVSLAAPRAEVSIGDEVKLSPLWGPAGFADWGPATTAGEALIYPSRDGEAAVV